MIFVLSTIVLSIILFFVYSSVLFNSFGNFPIAQKNTNYINSPFWVDMPESTIKTLIFFQILAAIGYVIWFVKIASNPPVNGLFVNKNWLIQINILFFLASIAWPFAAYSCVINPNSIKSSILASFCLCVAAFAMILLLAGTFEAKYENPIALVGILMTSVTVVLIDGVGWSALAINRSAY